MEFYDVINKRRTIREFADKDVSQNILTKILDAGLKAPSSDHMRQWSPVAIKDKSVIEQIAKCISAVPCNITEPKSPQQEMFKIALPKQHSMIAGANCLILPYFKQVSNLYNPNDAFSLINYGATWAFIENILLASTAESLGCAIHIPVGAEKDSIQSIINAPKEYIFPAIIAIGYPAENARVPSQVSATVEEKVHWNKWYSYDY